MAELDSLDPKKRYAKFTAEQVIEAIHASKGMQNFAARKLGCAPSTIRNYADRHPTVRQAINDERNLVLDTAELALFKAIQEGEAWAVCFTLKTIGKGRGYTERQEISGPDGGAIPVKAYMLVSPDDWPDAE